MNKPKKGGEKCEHPCAHKIEAECGIICFGMEQPEGGEDVSANYEILGLPVTLARVLDMMGSLRYEDYDDISQNQDYLLGLWDMEHDDLTLQSEATISFLYNLFIK